MIIGGRGLLMIFVVLFIFSWGEEDDHGSY